MSKNGQVMVTTLLSLHACSQWDLHHVPSWHLLEQGGRDKVRDVPARHIFTCSIHQRNTSCQQHWLHIMPSRVLLQLHSLILLHGLWPRYIFILHGTVILHAVPCWVLPEHIQRGFQLPGVPGWFLLKLQGSTLLLKLSCWHVLWQRQLDSMPRLPIWNGVQPSQRIHVLPQLQRWVLLACARDRGMPPVPQGVLLSGAGTHWLPDVHDRLLRAG